MFRTLFFKYLHQKTNNFPNPIKNRSPKAPARLPSYFITTPIISHAPSTTPLLALIKPSALG